MEKGILFIYSGKDKFQNAVACSTRQYIQENLKDYFAMLLLNVDKFNTIKHLADKRYDIIYIADNLQSLYDELMDNHKDKFNSIIQYNTYDSRVTTSAYGGFTKSTFNKIAKDLEKVVRDNSKTLTKYSYSKYGKCIRPEIFKEYDFNKLRDYETKNYYDSQEECKLSIKESLEKNIKNLEDSLSRAKEELNIVDEL